MKNMKKAISLLATVSILAAPLGAVPALAADSMNPPIVEVAQGQLRGYMDDNTFAFLGVPYANVPERFAMPEEAEPWEGIRDAQAYGATCLIPDQVSVGIDEMVWPHRYWIQNENCQSLNIWTQQLDSSAQKPVMVFMHGGGHTNGSSIEAVAYEGKNLSEYGDVVVVTLNHRLNVLGYLDLSAYGDEYKYSGNAGAADLIAALEWIHENISVFGGDPENVTIFGQSGGGGKVLTMLHTEETSELVDKVIVQSGGLSLLTKENSQKVAAKTLENLGLDESQVNELKTVPYADLIEAGTLALAQVSEETKEYIDWGPVADDDFIHTDLCEWSSEVPLMVGSTFSEFTSTLHQGDGRKNEWTTEETLSYLTERFGDNAKVVADEFQKVFPNKTIADAYFYATDFRQYVAAAAQQKLDAGTAPVYTYLFSYEAPVNGGTSAFHCVDLIYAFHNVQIPILTRATGGNEDALRIQDQVAGAWINFAATGNPSQEGLEWDAYTFEEKNIMQFDIESKCSVLNDDTLIELMITK